MQLIIENNKIKQNEIVRRTGKSLSTVKRIMDSLQKKRYIRRIDGKRYGSWEILIDIEKNGGSLGNEQCRYGSKGYVKGKFLTYATHYIDGEMAKEIDFRFNPLGLAGRSDFKNDSKEEKQIPKTDYIHILSPYHLVVYHDNYYCIGLKKDDKRIWHYRVDLMSNIEIVTDDSGREVPVEIIAFEGNPICNACWNPEKYMSEHLNMAYDETQDIRIKIRDTDYTIIHDWFGDHYEKMNEPCEEGYDIVRVRTSPYMIVHWAMQYGTSVEIMDEEIKSGEK